jgi:hypothetical protein
VPRKLRRIPPENGRGTLHDVRHGPWPEP